MSRCKFSSKFFKLLKEDITAGVALGSSASGYNPEKDQIQSGDTYATNDARIPKGPGVIQTRKGGIKIKPSKYRRKKRKNNGSRSLDSKYC